MLFEMADLSQVSGKPAGEDTAIELMFFKNSRLKSSLSKWNKKRVDMKKLAFLLPIGSLRQGLIMERPD
ncbi:hypothetical protein KJ656_03280 [bacterium]|nr:hypothetical protein [bacterium]